MSNRNISPIRVAQSNRVNPNAFFSSSTSRLNRKGLMILAIGNQNNIPEFVVLIIKKPFTHDPDGVADQGAAFVDIFGADARENISEIIDLLFRYSTINYRNYFFANQLDGLHKLCM